jgi:hypothetical protein
MGKERPITAMGEHECAHACSNIGSMSIERALESVRRGFETYQLS